MALLLYAISEIVQFKKYFIILCGVFHTISENALKTKENIIKIRKKMCLKTWHISNTNIIKTNKIKTESINPNSEEDELERLKVKCSLGDFEGQEKIILEDVIDALFYKESIRVGNVTVTRNKIRERLQLIVKENLVRLIKIYNSTS